MSCLSVCLRGLGGYELSVCLFEGIWEDFGEFSVCDISTYKQIKFLGKILQHCCGNSFSFLKGSGRGYGVQGVCLREDFR